jgi:hypothetical protein
MTLHTVYLEDYIFSDCYKPSQTIIQWKRRRETTPVERMYFICWVMWCTYHRFVISCAVYRWKVMGACRVLEEEIKSLGKGVVYGWLLRELIGACWVFKGDGDEPQYWRP